MCQRKINITLYHLYVISKLWYKWTYLQNRNRVTDGENKFTVTKRGESGGRDKLRDWAWHIRTTVYETDN